MAVGAGRASGQSEFTVLSGYLVQNVHQRHSTMSGRTLRIPDGLVGAFEHVGQHSGRAGTDGTITFLCTDKTWRTGVNDAIKM